MKPFLLALSAVVMFAAPTSAPANDIEDLFKSIVGSGKYRSQHVRTAADYRSPYIGPNARQPYSDFGRRTFRVSDRVVGPILTVQTTDDTYSLPSPDSLNAIPNLSAPGTPLGPPPAPVVDLVPKLAADIEAATERLCWDMHLNLSRRPGFRAAYAEAYELYRLARILHVGPTPLACGTVPAIDRANVARQMDVTLHRLQSAIIGLCPRSSLDAAVNVIAADVHALLAEVGVTCGAPPLPRL